MTATNKWTVFLLSACVPGAGQLAAKSWTCLGWFVAAGLLAASAAQWCGVRKGETWPAGLQMAASIALSLASAEHAKRLLESRTRSRRIARSQVTCAASRGRNLDIAITLEVRQSADQLWELVGDLPRFLTIDPFHDEVTLMRKQPAAGVDLVLSHNAFGRRFSRFGRIISWREGRGYTFSDLSPRGPKVGFPHVFIINVAQAAQTEQQSAMSRLTIRVRGRWTSRLVPAWIGRWWVWLVCREHARLLKKGL